MMLGVTSNSNPIQHHSVLVFSLFLFVTVRGSHELHVYLFNPSIQIKVSQSLIHNIVRNKFLNRSAGFLDYSFCSQSHVSGQNIAFQSKFGFLPCGYVIHYSLVYLAFPLLPGRLLFFLTYNNIHSSWCTFL